MLCRRQGIGKTKACRYKSGGTKKKFKHLQFNAMPVGTPLGFFRTKFITCAQIIDQQNELS